MPDPELARSLVLTYGWNSTSYQILNDGIRLWISAEKDAVIGFVERSRVRVVAGAPVCANDRLADVVAEFEASARDAGRRVCYFAAGHRLEALLRDSPGHSSIVIGAQPAWRPDSWPRMLECHASLRQQLNRARNKGVRTEGWTADRATDSPELSACLREWLHGRGLPPLHFLVEPATLSRLEDRLVFVAIREDRVVGFLVASPIPLRGGWLIEQIVRSARAPNGTAELLIDAAVREMAVRGDTFVTLGLAPLSHRAGVPAGDGPAWVRLLLEWTRAHVHRFYNFEGLEAFKAKFRPAVWEPIYLVSTEAAVSARTMHAVARAFSGGSVTRTIARAVGSAARQELRWITRR